MQQGKLASSSQHELRGSCLGAPLSYGQIQSFLAGEGFPTVPRRGDGAMAGRGREAQGDIYPLASWARTLESSWAAALAE